MLEIFKPRSVYDVIVLVACVAVVGTGTAYAANTVGSSDIIDESIVSQDIRNGGIGNQDIAVNSVSSSRVLNESLVGNDILNDTLTGADIDEGSLAQVPSAASADSAAVADHSVVSATVDNPAGQQTYHSVSCPAGTEILGGGIYGDSSSLDQDVNGSYPSGNGWAGYMNNGSAFDAIMRVYAICGQAVPTPGVAALPSSSKR